LCCRRSRQHIAPPQSRDVEPDWPHEGMNREQAHFESSGSPRGRKRQCPRESPMYPKLCLLRNSSAPVSQMWPTMSAQPKVWRVGVQRYGSRLEA
jgi:hypothetical protein